MSALSELRGRWLLVVTVAVAAGGAMAAYSFTAARHYRATSLLVVAPVSSSNPTFVGLDVLRETQRRTAAETAARLVRAPEVAEAVRVRLRLRGSAQSLLDKISTRVLGGSDVVAVSATDSDASRAAQIANSFVAAFVSARSAAFQKEVAAAVKRLGERLKALPGDERLGPEGTRLEQLLADTRALVGTADPTVRQGSDATVPQSAAWPHPVVWTLYAALIGLGAGALLALGLGLVRVARRREVVTAEDHDPPMPERSTEQLAPLESPLAEHPDPPAGEQAHRAVRELDAHSPVEEPPRAAGNDEPARGQELAARLEAVSALEAEVARHRDEPRQLWTGEGERPRKARAPLVEAPNGGWRLAEIEQLVEEHAHLYPDRVEDWRSYIFYLRDYLDAGGRVPGRFDRLIDDIFGELLVRQ